MSTTESSLAPFNMALTSYCRDTDRLNWVDPDQLLGGSDVYQEDVPHFGDPFLGWPSELDDFLCYAPSLFPKRQRTEGPNECRHYSGEYAWENDDVGIGEKKDRMSGPRRSRSSSAQSAAARERRRKIKEKTTELGRLVPGGRKMTTAEMLEAAHGYVRFLQAQVSLLQLDRPGRIGTLLGSTRIQEKLYAEDKCLATEELV